MGLKPGFCFDSDAGLKGRSFHGGAYIRSPVASFARIITLLPMIYS